MNDRKSARESRPQADRKANSKTGDRVTNALNEASEGIGWLQIVVSCTILATLLAALAFIIFPIAIAVIGAMFIVAIGLIAGIRLANRKHRQGGTVDFISRNNGNG